MPFCNWVIFILGWMAAGKLSNGKISKGDNKRQCKTELFLHCLFFFLLFFRLGKFSFDFLGKAFFHRLLLQIVADALDAADIDTGKNDLDFLFDRNQFKYLWIAHQRHNPRADLGLDHRHLGTS